MSNHPTDSNYESTLWEVEDTTEVDSGYDKCDSCSVNDVEFITSQGQFCDGCYPDNEVEDK